MEILGLICPSFSNKYKQKGNLINIYQSLGVSSVKEVHIENFRQNEFFQYLKELASGYEAIAFGFDDSEFYSYFENKRLLDNFTRFGASIAYGENYPDGIIFDLIKTDILELLENLRNSQNIEITREFLKNIIEVDVNIFELENIYPIVNISSLRLSFFSDSMHNQYTIQKIKQLLKSEIQNQNSRELPVAKDDGLRGELQLFGKVSFEFLAKVIRENRDVLRTLPRYCEISLCSKHYERNFLNSFGGKKESKQIPRAITTAEMKESEFSIIIEKLQEFSAQAVVCLGGLGDPTCNPNWLKMVQKVLQSGFQCIVETFAIGWTRATTDKLLALPEVELGNLKVVFKINAIKKEIEERVIGFEDNTFAERLENIEYFLLRAPEKGYVQAIKVQENVEHILDLYKHFKKYKSNVLIAKYNNYRELLTERRAFAVKPLQQTDCWHLKHDMYIDEQGSVWLCKQDVNLEHSIGNAVKEDLYDIFMRGQAYYEKHLGGWSFCKNCDEYYTFNF